MELEFHAGFFKQLDFCKIKFLVETRFSKNRVSKQGHISKQFQTNDILLESLAKGVKPIFGQFSWVRRLGNTASHEAANFSLTSYQSFVNNGNLSTVLEFVCISLFGLILLQIIKKINKNHTSKVIHTIYLATRWFLGV